MALSARLMTLRRSPILLRLPPYLSFIGIAVGIIWLLLLPLNEYSRSTYISENAILPGQVHTYFGGSEHNVFRAFRQEVFTISTYESEEQRADALQEILKSFGLKAAKQHYSFHAAGETIEGTNVYGLLQGPRADATEAMVLIAAWRNFENEINYSGVALALTLARYFQRWSVWSKDIIVLIPADSTYGPEAWVSAYHSTSSVPTAARNISALPIKAGALQGAVALDYPAGPWGQRYDKIDILYDGINGALPNLDLLNTAVQIAQGQMGMGSSLHGMVHHTDSYTDRLECITRGIFTQAAGHATGPHSAFMPYHVDAITLKTVGDGWHDEMTLGKVAESTFRSINNLLEKLHQSFFFYILMNTSRFVSIGSYLPAAMLVAGSFTINALALWVLSGRGPVVSAGRQTKLPETSERLKEKVSVAVKLDSKSDAKEIITLPKVELESVERNMLLPAITLVAVHAAGFLPLYVLTQMHQNYLAHLFYLVAGISYTLPLYLSVTLVRLIGVTSQQLQIMQSFSLLVLGAVLSTWATINFSLALLIGLLATPLNFARPLPLFSSSTSSSPAEKSSPLEKTFSITAALLWLLASPPVAVFALSFFWKKSLSWLLLEIAKGWSAQGVWGSLIVWAVWWPAWVVGGVVVVSGLVPASPKQAGSNKS